MSFLQWFSYVHILKRFIWYIYIYIYISGDRGIIVIVVGRWIRRPKFKTWMRLITFHIVLIHLKKVWIQLFSLQLWINSKTDWIFEILVRQPVLEKENTEFKTVKFRLRIDLVSHPDREKLENTYSWGRGW